MITSKDIKRISAPKLLAWLYKNNKRSALDGLVLLAVIRDSGLSPADIADRVSGNRQQSSSIDKSLKRLINDGLVTKKYIDFNTDHAKCAISITQRNVDKISKLLF